jgi:hypothetical protein
VEHLGSPKEEEVVVVVVVMVVDVKVREAHFEETEVENARQGVNYDGTSVVFGAPSPLHRRQV